MAPKLRGFTDQRQQGEVSTVKAGSDFKSKETSFARK